MSSPRNQEISVMINQPMDSSASKTIEVTAMYLVSFTDGISMPENIGGFISDEYTGDPDQPRHWSRWDPSANTLPEALELAADYMAAFRKDLKAAGCEVPEDAQCFIDMRICSTRGTTTQTVHRIS